MTASAALTIAVIVAGSFIGGAVLVLIAIFVHNRLHGNESGLGEEGSRDILGYGPAAWTLHTGNGRPDSDDEKDPAA